MHYPILSHKLQKETQSLILKLTITMRLRAPFLRHTASSPSLFPTAATFFTQPPPTSTFRPPQSKSRLRLRTATQPLESRRPKLTVSATAIPDKRPLDLTEDNVIQAIADARVELAQIFDTSVGMTGLRIFFCGFYEFLDIEICGMKLREEK